jgi:DNA-binding CsgD family transcriptional regulator
VISSETVKSHIHNVLLKFGLRSKSDLRLLLLDLGIRWWQDDTT